MLINHTCLTKVIKIFVLKYIIITLKIHVLFSLIKYIILKIIPQMHT